MLFAYAAPSSAKSLVIVCNGGLFFNKEAKSGPHHVSVSASVTVDLKSQTSELLLGSKNDTKIGIRSNSNLEIITEKEKGEILLTGATPDETIYFTLNPRSKSLFVSYSDYAFKFTKCINMGN